MGWYVVVIAQQEKSIADAFSEKTSNLKAIIDNLDELIVLFNVEGKVLDCNKPFVECLNKEYNEILDTNIDVLNIFSAHGFAIIINKTSKIGNYIFEDKLLCDSEMTVSASISVQKIHYNGNEGILCIIKKNDGVWPGINSQKSSEKIYFDIIENVNDGIAILKDGRIKFANRKSVEMVDYTKEEVIGQDFLKFIAPEFHAKILLHHNNAIIDQDHIENRFEINLVSKNGERIPIEVSDCPIDFENQKSYLVIFREIAKRKQIEKAALEEKKKLENYLDVAGSIIGILDKDQRIVLLNKKGCEVLGYSREEIIGQNWFDVFLPEKVRDKTRKTYDKMMAGEIKAPEYMENWIVTKKGEERLVHWHDVVLKDGNENITGVISSGEDITDQKIIQKKLHESESKIRTIFNSIDDQVYICDEERNIIDLNDSATKHLGYQRDELLNMKYDQLIVPEHRGTIKKCVKKLFEKKHRVFETTLLRKYGSIFPVEVNARLIDYDGKNAIICVSRDISERKNAENKLKEYAEELKESNELKELFTDIIRHDLLTPATIIKGYTEELLTKKWDENTTTTLEKINNHNERLIILLESATRLSKLQKTDEIEFEDLNIVAIFQMVVDSLKPKLSEKNQNINVHTSIKCNSKVNYIIEEVFSNLLSNAIKYSPNNSNISVDFIDMDDEWKVTVTDEGIGIHDKDKKYIFDRFQRLDKAGIKGTGLGLAIVKRIIELHGGKLGVKDNPDGQGSIFWFTVKKSTST